jgi:hypothetical protein
LFDWFIFFFRKLGLYIYFFHFDIKF